MDIRMQVTMEERAHRQARDRAASMGISLAEYVRRLVRRDLSDGERSPSVSLDELIGIGDSGGSDVAAHKDDYLGAAIATDQG
jgi:putative heme degradation protein